MNDSRPATPAVGHNFGKAAGSYDSSAHVQREIADHLLRLVDVHPLGAIDGALLDAGCGTGLALDALAARHPGRSLLALDLALPMLARCRHNTAHHHCISGDLQALPLRSDCLAAVWSNLSLQWCEPGRAMAEIARTLKPGGVAWLATLGSGTFRELRAAFAGVDAAQHVLTCHPAAHWERSASAAGLTLAALECFELQARASGLRELLQGIKAVGALLLFAAIAVLAVSEL